MEKRQVEANGGYTIEMITIIYEIGPRHHFFSFSKLQLQVYRSPQTLEIMLQRGLMMRLASCHQFPVAPGLRHGDRSQPNIPIGPLLLSM